jgi:hypothetical protein
MMSEEVELFIIKGVAGLSIYVGNEDGGYRLAGCKPWGGGTSVARWKVNKQELLKAIQGMKPLEVNKTDQSVDFDKEKSTDER